MKNNTIPHTQTSYECWTDRYQFAIPINFGKTNFLFKFSLLIQPSVGIWKGIKQNNETECIFVLPVQIDFIVEVSTASICSLLWCLESGEQLHFAGFMIEGCLEQRERSRVMNTISQRYESLISTKLLSSTFHFHMLFSDEFVLKWWTLNKTKYFCLFRFRCIWV